MGIHKSAGIAVAVAIAVLFSISMVQAGVSGTAAQGPAAQGIDAGCKQDAATAGCGADQVGTGLLKCLHAYKKANKSYQFTSSCKQAMQTARQERGQRHGGQSSHNGGGNTSNGG